jgi:hypothetical protein
MGTSGRGIEGLLFETHNWGKAVSFWQALGFELEFETDHHSGQLRHPAGGPYLFIAERPRTQHLQIVPAVAVKDAAQFTPPSSASVIHPFEKQHWPALQMLLADPDGRQVGVNAPLPESERAD